MKQRKKRLNKVLSLLLTLSMLLSMLVIPAAAADPISDYPDDLDAIVELLSGADGVDGESAFDYLGTVFLGWRTTGGPWQNYVINDFVGQTMVDAGYTDAGDSWTTKALISPTGPTTTAMTFSGSSTTIPPPWCGPLSTPAWRSPPSPRAARSWTTPIPSTPCGTW